MQARVWLGLMLGVLAGPSLASVDRSAPPGGVYRLKPGIYVEQGTPCESPPNAAIRQYDGRGIATPHSRACRATVLSRRGRTFVVRQSCIGAGSGPAPRFVEQQQVTVRDALTFAQQTRGAGTTFRYCPWYQLPAGLQNVFPH